MLASVSGWYFICKINNLCLNCISIVNENSNPQVPCICLKWKWGEFQFYRIRAWTYTLVQQDWYFFQGRNEWNSKSTGVINLSIIIIGGISTPLIWYIFFIVIVNRIPVPKILYLVVQGCCWIMQFDIFCRLSRGLWNFGSTNFIWWWMECQFDKFDGFFFLSDCVLNFNSTHIL